MNANPDQEPPYQDDHLQLDFVLGKLYKAVNGLNINTTQNVTITFTVGEPEDLNEYLYTSDFLKEDKVIEKYKRHSSGQEEYIEEDIGGSRYVQEVHSYKITYKLKPKVLIKYMIDTSRLSKYSLALDKQRNLILNDKYILSTSHFDSVNSNFIEYALQNPRKKIRVEDLKEKAGKIEKRFHAILAQVIKNSELRKVFFPSVSKDAFEFRNEVHTKDLTGEDINEKKINNFIKALKKVSNK